MHWLFLALYPLTFNAIKLHLDLLAVVWSLNLNSSYFAAKGEVVGGEGGKNVTQLRFFTPAPSNHVNEALLPSHAGN